MIEIKKLRSSGAGWSNLATKFGFMVAAIAVTSIVGIFSGHAFATTYGTGNYSGCSYTEGCDQSSGSSSSSSSASSSSGSSGATLAQTSTGLDVVINLEDAQVITQEEYDVVIVPLKGTEKLFQKADFYLDGVLVYSGVPAKNGTLKWTWNTKDNPATKVRILIYDTNGEVIAKEFTVTISLTGSSQTTVSNPVPVHTSDTQTDTTPVGAEAQGSSGAVWLWIFFILIILIVLGALLFLLRRRKRNDQNQLPPSSLPPQQFYQ